MTTDTLSWTATGRLEVFRRAIDEDLLLELARTKWAAWLGADGPDVTTALAAYRSDPRCRTLAPNPLFDECWYRRQHPDVSQGIRRHRITSGFEHFLHRGVFEGRPFNSYVHRRMGWCTAPAPAVEETSSLRCDPDALDDEARAFLSRFPHVPAAVYYNRYGRFLGGTPPRPRPLLPRARTSVPATALLVLGMHRSGTSTLAAALVAAGCVVGSDLFPPSRSNPLGFWESRGVSRTLDGILALAGSSWDDPRAVRFPDERTRAGATRQLRDSVAATFPGSPLFAIKDPRSCRLAGVWREALGAAGASTKVVIPLRHPLEVAASLADRDGFPIEKGLALWTRHLLDALRATRGLPRTTVRYDDLLADGPGELERIGTDLGLRWPVAAAERATRLAGLIDPVLRHQKTLAGVPIGHPDRPWIAALWALVNDGRAALERHDEVDAIDRAFALASGGAPAATDG